MCVPEENKTDRKSEDDDGVEAYEKLLNPRVVEHLWVDFFFASGGRERWVCSTGWMKSGAWEKNL